MRIEADPTNGEGVPWDDEYDEGTIRHYQQNDKNGYFHELYVLINDIKSHLVITNEGVSIEHIDGETLLTNITPNQLFPDKKELGWNEVCDIIRILEKERFEFLKYSKEEMDEFYKQYLAENN